MRTTFQCRLLNRPFDDTSLYVRMRHEKHAFLLDAGNLGNITNREIMKISHLFISHTHIDHFIGFDTLLRVLLRREAPLNVYGPAGIAKAVESKLGGYTWNMIRNYPIKLNIFSIDDGLIRHTGFSAKQGFKRQGIGVKPFNGSLISVN